MVKWQFGGTESQSPSHRGTFSDQPKIERTPEGLLVVSQSPSHRGTFSDTSVSATASIRLKPSQSPSHRGTFSDVANYVSPPSLQVHQCPLLLPLLIV